MFDHTQNFMRRLCVGEAERINCQVSSAVQELGLHEQVFPLAIDEAQEVPIGKYVDLFNIWSNPVTSKELLEFLRGENNQPVSSQFRSFEFAAVDPTKSLTDSQITAFASIHGYEPLSALDKVAFRLKSYKAFPESLLATAQVQNVLSIRSFSLGSLVCCWMVPALSIDGTKKRDAAGDIKLMISQSVGKIRLGPLAISGAEELSKSA